MHGEGYQKNVEKQLNEQREYWDEVKDTQELVEIEETDILGAVSDGKINIKRESSGHESTQMYLYTLKS